MRSCIALLALACLACGTEPPPDNREPVPALKPVEPLRADPECHERCVRDGHDCSFRMGQQCGCCRVEGADRFVTVIDGFARDSRIAPGNEPKLIDTDLGTEIEFGGER
jgi:hypothetical protein